MSTASGRLQTYHIDTSIARDGNDGVERTEVDAHNTHLVDAMETAC